MTSDQLARRDAEQPKIQRAQLMLQRTLEQAVVEARHGHVGVKVTIRGGAIVVAAEHAEFTEVLD